MDSTRQHQQLDTTTACSKMQARGLRRLAAAAGPKKRAEARAAREQPFRPDEPTDSFVHDSVNRPEGKVRSGG